MNTDMLDRGGLAVLQGLIGSKKPEQVRIV
jgi:hypothetical protein